MKIFGTIIAGILLAIFTVMGCQFTYQCGYNLGKSMNISKETSIPTPQVIIIKEEIQPVIVEHINDTIAFKNKNPLNVKFNKTSPWKGQIGKDKFGHAVFSSWEYGVRAASYVLKNYSKKHKIDTIEGIVKRFAEGNNKEYISFLCKRMNLKKNEKFDVIKRMNELLKAMSRFESGQDLPDELFVPYDVIAHI